MSEFASCYFCGTALDAQIEPYPVIPEDAGTDDRPTVDLCPVCRRKLSKVLDVALSAADDAEVAATPLAAGPDPSPLEADHEDPTADLGSEDEEPAYAVEPSGEATAVEDTAEAEDDGSTDDEGDVDSADGDDGEADAVSGADEAEDGAAVTNAEAPETENESADRTSDDDSASAESAAEADDAVANGEEPGRATDDGGEAEEPGADDHTEADEGETAESESDKPAILSTPAAQKIIKLLQNREFPVEREEIEVVASNAYEIPQQDCDDVIEALVSEGYVGERKGKLVRPEE